MFIEIKNKENNSFLWKEGKKILNLCKSWFGMVTCKTLYAKPNVAFYTCCSSVNFASITSTVSTIWWYYKMSNLIITESVFNSTRLLCISVGGHRTRCFGFCTIMFAVVYCKLFSKLKLSHCRLVFSIKLPSILNTSIYEPGKNTRPPLLSSICDSILSQILVQSIYSAHIFVVFRDCKRTGYIYFSSPSKTLSGTPSHSSSASSSPDMFPSIGGSM